MLIHRVGTWNLSRSEVMVSTPMRLEGEPMG